MREYDVCYGTKEWLLERGWFIIAFNPPGSQGTFTIPNPSKDPKYRGQTGSESPDIIAYKNKFLFVIEAKPSFNEKDVLKLKTLLGNKPRLDLLLKISEKICSAHKVQMTKSPRILIGKAHAEPICAMEGIQTFTASTKPGWDPDKIDPLIAPYSFIDIVFHPEDDSILEVV